MCFLVFFEYYMPVEFTVAYIKEMKKFASESFLYFNCLSVVHTKKINK